MATVRPIADWTYTDAAAAPTAHLVKDYDVVRRMIEEHDMWLDGQGWLGHRTGDPVVDAQIRANVRPQFVADDVVGEMVENRSNGLLEQEADVSLIARDPNAEEPAEDEPDPAGDGLVAMSAWWDKKHFWEQAAKAIDRVSCYKRGDLRAFVAPGNLVNGALPTGKKLAEALDLIEIEAPPPTHAVIVKDRDTQRPAAVVITGQERDQKTAEVWSVNPANGKTVYRLFSPAVAVPTTIELELGGRLPLGEARGPRIMSEPVRQMQFLLNFITTMTGRTVETAGNRERYFKNAEPPVMWLRAKPLGTPIIKTDTSTGETLYGVAVPPILGAGVAMFLKGLATTETKGSGQQETIASPDITTLDPVDPAFATNAADKVKASLYKRAKQGHLANTSTAEASGLAYQQARAQFAADLKRVKGPVEGMIRDVLECVLALAALMSDEAKQLLATFRVAVTLHITAGPITPDEARLATELRDKGAISRATMMARVGVEDPAAEEAAIEEEPEAIAARWKAIAETIMALTGINGMTAEGAAFLMGLSEEQIEVFRTGDAPAPTPTTQPALAAVA